MVHGATVGHGLGAVPKMIIVKRFRYCDRVGVLWHQNNKSGNRLNLSTNAHNGYSLFGLIQHQLLLYLL